MRKGLAICLVFVLLFALASCSFSFRFSDPGTAEESVTEHTYVITTQGLVGLYRMVDGVQWRENTLCALQYIGSKETYTDKLNALYSSRFSSVDQESFNAMRRVDAGGNDVFLVVPRFDLESIAVFGVQTDSEGKTHVLKQYAELAEPFLLICSAGEDANVQLSATLQNTAGHYRVFPQRSLFSGVVSFPSGFQPIENS